MALAMKIVESSQPASGQADQLMELVTRMAKGDQNALGQFYDLTNRAAFALVLRIVKDRNVAEEVLIDVYRQAWQQSANYSAERGKPIIWLFIIARTRSIDRLRVETQYRNRHQSFESAPPSLGIAAEPEKGLIEAEQQQMVRQALAQLSTDQRRVIELAYYSDLSQSEIAAALKEPIGTVKSRMRAAMIKLRELLSNCLTTATAAKSTAQSLTQAGAQAGPGRLLTGRFNPKFP